MGYQINGKTLPPLSTTNANRQSQNRVPLSKNILMSSHLPTQTKPLQANSIGIKSQNAPQSGLSQLLKNDILTAGQKNSFHNLTAFLSVILTDKFSNMLISPAKNMSLENSPTSHLFNISNPENSFFTKADLTTYVSQIALCENGVEEIFVDSLIEICTPEQRNFWGEESAYEFTTSAKHQLYEFNVEPQSDRLQIIAKLLGDIQKIPHAISDEQKKLLLEKLKETEEDEEIKGFDFDWASISKVDN